MRKRNAASLLLGATLVLFGCGETTTEPDEFAASLQACTAATIETLTAAVLEAKANPDLERAQAGYEVAMTALAEHLAACDAVRPLASVALLSVGGPDPFGYVFIDSDEPGGPAYDFEDISGSGTALGLGDDQVSGGIPLGFTFSYYGVDYSQVHVSSNGFLTVLPGQYHGCCLGQPIPTAGSPNGVIAGWWEDLNPSAAGTVHYQTLGAAPNRRFIVQFTSVPHYPNNNPTTFQFKLFEGSNFIEVHYQAALTNGAPHTAGIENEDGAIGLQYYRGGDALTTPLAVRYFTGAPVITSVTGTPAPVGSPLVAEFTDPNPGDTHTCTIAWDAVVQPGVVVEPSGGNPGTCTGTFPAEAGFYDITVTVTDDLGASGTATVEAIVYDPGRFVTGGGWIVPRVGFTPPYIEEGFETGDLSGWNLTLPTTGDGGFGGAVTDFAGYLPVSGSYFALLKSNGPGSYSTLTKSFTVMAGDRISGSAFFLSQDAGSCGAFNDNASVRIFDENDVEVAVPFYAEACSGNTEWIQWEHTFAAGGTYTVEAKVSNLGDSIFDAWIGLDDVALASEVLDKTNFGFNAKYKKNETVPTGQLQFQVRELDINFHSSSYDWLVIPSDNVAVLKGAGTINGMGDYPFMLWAGDGAPDTFRMMIWEENGETVLFDSATQELGGGNIKVHD